MSETTACRDLEVGTRIQEQLRYFIIKLKPSQDPAARAIGTGSAIRKHPARIMSDQVWDRQPIKY